MLGIFRDSWQGKASLAKAFWLVYFVFGIIINLIVLALLSATMPGFNYEANSNLLMSIVFPYTLFSAICVWRCGKNSYILWNVLAKVVVVLALLGGLLALIHVIRGY